MRHIKPNKRVATSGPQSTPRQGTQSHTTTAVSQMRPGEVVIRYANSAIRDALPHWFSVTRRSISTATKYRNTNTAIYHPAGLCATLPCSATKIVAAA